MMMVARSATETLFFGLPTLKIRFEAAPSLFSMMRRRQSTPSSMKVNERL